MFNNRKGFLAALLLLLALTCLFGQSGFALDAPSLATATATAIEAAETTFSTSLSTTTITTTTDSTATTSSTIERFGPLPWAEESYFYSSEVPYAEQQKEYDAVNIMDAAYSYDTLAAYDDYKSTTSTTTTATDEYIPEEEEVQPTRVDAAAIRPTTAQLAPVPQATVCRTHGQVAVTYSEGPSDATASVVRQLNEADARATFFVNATWLYDTRYASVVQNTYNAGHFIGMTYRVKNDDSSKLTDEEIRNDILRCATIIQDIIQVAPKYVRLHYTQPEDIRTENILKDLGFVLVGYNLDSQDYLHKPVDQVYRSAFRKQKETYDAKGSFISIQYDMPGTASPAQVAQMINVINEEEYTMVRLDGCLNDPKPYKKSAGSKEYIADRFSFNTAGYHQGQKPVATKQQQQQQQPSQHQQQEAQSQAANRLNFYSAISILASVLLAIFLDDHHFF